MRRSGVPVGLSQQYQGALDAGRGRNKDNLQLR